MLTATPKQQSKKQERDKDYIMTITLKHPDCNGWAIVDKYQVQRYSPRNFHVVEAKIIADNSDVYVYLNSSHETCCKLPIKSQWRYHSYYYASQVNALRNKLAELENNSLETCGNCVSHFYADPED